MYIHSEVMAMGKAHTNRYVMCAYVADNKDEVKRKQIGLDIGLNTDSPIYISLDM